MLTFLSKTQAAAALIACASLAAGDVMADGVTPANRAAYQIALKCYVVLAYAGDERRRAGDEVKAAVYEKKARKSFDMAFAAGKRVELTDDSVRRDLDFTQETELPKLVRDEQYFLSSASTCKAVGLL